MIEEQIVLPDMNKKMHLTQQLLNEYQHDFPLSESPYQEIAERLGVDEVILLNLLKEMDESGLLSRVGAVFRPNRVGVSTLAAMAVPEQRLQQVANVINAYAAVNHNYERQHHFNLWFVVIAETAEQLDNILLDMQFKTHIKIMSLPMEKDYHIDLGFPVKLDAERPRHD